MQLHATPGRGGLCGTESYAPDYRRLHAQPCESRVEFRYVRLNAALDIGDAAQADGNDPKSPLHDGSATPMFR